jgi:hypothetical protein
VAALALLGLTDLGAARVSASPIYSAVVLSGNPQGYWRLGEAPGSTTAVDSSPFGRNGTYMGGVTLGVPGAIVADPNTAARFNGSTGYVSIPGGPFNFTNNFTLEAWVINNNTSGVARIFSNRTATGGYGLGVLPGGQLRFTTFTEKDYDSSVIVPRDGNFHFVAVTFDSTDAANFYLDGVFQQQITGTQPAASGATEFDIGRNPNVAGEFFNGTIDEAAVFNRVLSGAEIAAQFQAGIAVAIPEPTTLALFGLGACGLLGHAWRRRKKSS